MKKVINRWLVVAGSMIIGLFGGLVYAWSIFVKPVCETYGWNVGQVAMMGAVMMACFAVGNSLGGIILPKIGSTMTGVIGSFLFGMGILLSAFVRNPVLMYLTWGVMGGYGIGNLYSIGMFVASQWFPDKRGMIMGLFLALFGLSLTVFTKPISVMLSIYGVQSTMVIMGITFLVILLPTSLFLMKTPPDGWKPRQLSKENSYKEEMISCTVEEASKTFAFKLFAAVFFFMAIPYTFINSYASVFCVDYKGLTTNQSVVIISMMGVGACLGRILSGIMLDKIGCRKTFYICSAASFAACVLMLRSDSYLGLLLAFFLCSYGYGGRTPIYGVWPVEQWGSEYATVIYGICSTAMIVSMLFGPMITSIAGYTVGCIVGILSVIFGTLCIWITPKVSAVVEKNKRGTI